MKAETVEDLKMFVELDDIACHEPVDLSARVEIFEKGTAPSGEPYMRLRLYDSSGWVGAFARCGDWAGHGLVDGQLRDLSLHTADTPKGQRVLVAHPDYGQPPCERDALDLLPAHRAPNPEDLGRLIDLVDGLETEGYRAFVRDVFSDPDFAISFVTGTASGRCHHAEQGGLLNHSLEVAEAVSVATERMSVATCIREAGILLALFHDVGKCAVPDAHRIPEKRHKRLIEYHLQEPMAALRKRDRDAHDALWLTIAAYRSGETYGAPMAALVQGLDQCSAQADVAQRALRAGRKGYWHRFCGGRPVWMPPRDPERPAGWLGSA